MYVGNVFVDGFVKKKIYYIYYLLTFVVRNYFVLFFVFCNVKRSIAACYTFFFQNAAKVRRSVAVNAFYRR
jgi:hypothetical protein